ncbi:MAG: hypothetical protein GY854_12445, partial [Deltaproteobacteria bacterium]|nr:hypothetical protein [Deltaproteobacteria bacterium]
YDPNGDTVENSCCINSSAQWLTVALTWQGDPEDNRLVCNLQAPDGTLIDIHGRTKTAPRRRVISMPLPTFNYGKVVDHPGQWRLHIMGTSSNPVPYQVFWIVDDHHTHLEVDRYKWFYELNDTLKLKMRLVQGDKPLRQDFIKDSTVELASPAVDLNTFVRDLKVKDDDIRRLKKKDKTLKQASKTRLKLAYLSSQKNVVANLTRMEVNPLPIDYKRGYLESSMKLTKPGLHQVKLRLQALDERGHRIMRERTLNFFVNPKRAKGKFERKPEMAQMKSGTKRRRDKDE